MNRITPIVLLVLLLLLGAYVVIFEMLPETRIPLKEELRTDRIFGDRADPRLVLRIRVERESDTLVLERNVDGDWRMVEPYQASVKQDLANEAVRGLLQLQRVTADIAKADWPEQGLAAYGLNRPKLTVTVTFLDGKQMTLEAGAPVPTQPFIYAMVPDDDAVAVVPDIPLRMLQIDVKDFRRESILAFDRAKAVKIALRSARSDVEIVREDKTWNVVKPYEDHVDVLNLDRLFKTIDSVEARSFVAEGPPSLKPYGLDEPRVSLTYTLSGERMQTTQTLLLGAAAEESPGTVYAVIAGEPNVYAVPEGLVGALTFDALWLRDRKLFWLGRYDVKRLSIERPAGALIFERDERRNIWVISEPGKYIAEESEVNRFIAVMGTLEAARFPNDNPDEGALKEYGLDPASRIVVTVKRWDKPDIVLHAGRIDPKEKDLYVRRGEGGPVYTVQGSFLAALTAPALAFRDRTVADLGRQTVTKVSIKGGDAVVTVVREKGDQWRMTEPVSAPANDIAVDKLVDRLEQLKAVELLAEKPEDVSKWGLDSPIREVVFNYRTPDGGSQTATLLIGNPVEDQGYAAMFKGRDLVFVLWPGISEHLQAEFRRQIVWQFRRDGLREYVWNDGKDTVRLRDVGGQWELIEPADATPRIGQVTDMVGFLLNLRVERFAAYTKDDLAKFGLDKPRATVTLKFDDGDRVLSLGGPAANKGDVYAMVADQDPIFAIPSQFARWLLTRPLVGAEPLE